MAAAALNLIPSSIPAGVRPRSLPLDRLRHVYNAVTSRCASAQPLVGFHSAAGSGMEAERSTSEATAASAGDAEEPTQYRPAARAITTPAQLQRFLASSVCDDFVAFVLALNDATRGQANDAVAADALSPGVRATVDMLHTISRWVDETPPETTAMRYGNPAFRTFFARLTDEAASLTAALLPAQHAAAAVELAPYLVDSFGNHTRIDYGTGHETTFVAWLYCLSTLGTFGEQDRIALVSHVFLSYLTVMRKLQTTYWLEPAGSHGVWGLDDYQFLPFLWGAAQLVGHQHIRPDSIHSADVVNSYGDKYLYLGCIEFLKSVKKGALQETSPMLNDISGVPNWQKVNSGMIKMYKAEVLSKFPIMQHFLFGSILPFVDV